MCLKVMTGLTFIHGESVRLVGRLYSERDSPSCKWFLAATWSVLCYQRLLWGIY
uniref:Uncharacterized protein n=1 Tax=Anguilla anguilla TaxID=7936 RepID=A0A0E9R0U5_ANGAN